MISDLEESSVRGRWALPSFTGYSMPEAEIKGRAKEVRAGLPDLVPREVGRVGPWEEVGKLLPHR